MNEKLQNVSILLVAVVTLWACSGNNQPSTPVVTATVTPIPAANLRVIEEHQLEFDEPALLGPSPDGRRLAGHNRK